MILRFSSHKAHGVGGFPRRNLERILLNFSGTLSSSVQAQLRRNHVQKWYHAWKVVSSSTRILSWLSRVDFANVEHQRSGRNCTINSGVINRLLKSFNRIFQQKWWSCWKILLKSQNHGHEWVWTHKVAPSGKVELIPCTMRYSERASRSSTLLRFTFQHKTCWKLCWKICWKICWKSDKSGFSTPKKKKWTGSVWDVQDFT